MTRLDVVVHVIAGWQEMLRGLVSAADSEPTVDAAIYWPAFPIAYATADEVPTLMFQRRRTAAYARPASATDELHDVAAALLRGSVHAGTGATSGRGMCSRLVTSSPSGRSKTWYTTLTCCPTNRCLQAR